MNEPKTLENFYVRPQIVQNENEIDKTLELEFFFEKGAPFILLNTNLCERPLKLLIDTGASVSIVASDIIKENIQKTNYFFSLFGIAGKEVSVTTEGMVNGILNFDNTLLGSTFHLVDRKYAGTADGYLGFDFLAPYKVNIDLDKMCLRINLKNIFSSAEKMNTDKEETEEIFLNILAQNFEFERNESAKAQLKILMNRKN